MRRPVVLLLFALAALALGCSGDASTAPPTASGSASPNPPSGEPATEGIEGVIAVTGLTNAHTQERVEYPTYPPMGGDHFPVWWNCGFYDQPIADEPAVHALEHGAIWITYSPDLAADSVAHLRALADSDGHILVSPYPDLRAPLVVTAWGRQLDLDSVEDPRLDEFISTYIRAGDAPEPGARCDGGLTPGE